MSAGVGKKASKSVKKEQMQYKSEEEKEGRESSIIHDEISWESNTKKMREYIPDVSR